MIEFTPGPLRQGDIVELLLNNKCREIICDDGKIGLVYGIIDQDNKANARLIAAAPELHEACEAMVKAWNQYCIGNNKRFEEMEEAAHRAVLAIQKARCE